MTSLPTNRAYIDAVAMGFLPGTRFNHRWYISFDGTDTSIHNRIEEKFLVRHVCCLHSSSVNDSLCLTVVCFDSCLLSCF